MGKKVKGRFCCFRMGTYYTFFYANENYPKDRENKWKMEREEIILGAKSLR